MTLWDAFRLVSTVRCVAWWTDRQGDRQTNIVMILWDAFGLVTTVCCMTGGWSNGVSMDEF